jgi:hypothetical protein
MIQSKRAMKQDIFIQISIGSVVFILDALSAQCFPFGIFYYAEA